MHVQIYTQYTNLCQKTFWTWLVRLHWTSLTPTHYSLDWVTPLCKILWCPILQLIGLWFTYFFKRFIFKPNWRACRDTIMTINACYLWSQHLKNVFQTHIAESPTSLTMSNSHHMIVDKKVLSLSHWIFYQAPSNWWWYFSGCSTASYESSLFLKYFVIRIWRV